MYIIHTHTIHCLVYAYISCRYMWVKIRLAMGPTDGHFDHLWKVKMFLRKTSVVSPNSSVVDHFASQRTHIQQMAISCEVAKLWIAAKRSRWFWKSIPMSWIWARVPGWNRIGFGQIWWKQLENPAKECPNEHGEVHLRPLKTSVRWMFLKRCLLDVVCLFEWLFNDFWMVLHRAKHRTPWFYGGPPNRHGAPTQEESGGSIRTASWRDPFGRGQSRQTRLCSFMKLLCGV